MDDERQAMNSAVTDIIFLKNLTIPFPLLKVKKTTQYPLLLSVAVDYPQTIFHQ